jgi:acyl carrier protein
MNHDDAQKLVHICIREVAPEVNLDTVPTDADLRDSLHLDSLDFLQIVELLSERGHIRIDEEDYPQLATLDSTVSFVTGRAG